MDFQNILWADSDIDKIEIEHDCARLFIYNDVLQQDLIVKCTGFIGLDNLCIWDDMIISHAEVCEAKDNSVPFIRQLFSAYDKDINYGERWLNKGILVLRICLVNRITFSIYCQAIDVETAKSSTT